MRKILYLHIQFLIHVVKKEYLYFILCIINSFHKNVIFISTKIRNIIFLYEFKMYVLYIDKLLIYEIL